MLTIISNAVKAASRKKRLSKSNKKTSGSSYRFFTEINTIGNIQTVIRNKSQINLDLIVQPMRRKIEIS